MCELCEPQVSRRDVIGRLLVGGAALTGATLLGPPTARAAVPVAPGLTIQPRSNWAGEGRQPTGPLAPESVEFLLVHHTASANGADPISTMRGAYAFHTGPEKGWPDVAYNFFIDHNGVTWEGRAGSIAGPIEASATGGSQGFAQLVCLLGDFTEVLPTPAALSSLNQVLAWLADRYEIAVGPTEATSFVSRGSNRWPEGSVVETNTVAGHRDMSQTACPGDTFYPYLVANVPAEVAALLSAGAPPVTTPPTTTSASTASTQPTGAPQTSVEPVTTPLAAPSSSTTSVNSTTSIATGQEQRSSDSGASPLLIAGLAGVTIASGAAWYARRRSPSPSSSEPGIADDHPDG